MTRRPDRSETDPEARRSADARGATGTGTGTDRLPEPLGQAGPDASLGGIPKTGDSPLRPPDAPAAGREPAQVMTDGRDAQRRRRDDEAGAQAQQERRSDVPNETPAEQVGRTSRRS